MALAGFRLPPCRRLVDECSSSPLNFIPQSRQGFTQGLRIPKFAIESERSGNDSATELALSTFDEAAGVS